MQVLRDRLTISLRELRLPLDYYGNTMRDRLTVGLMPLKHAILVRIQVPQPPVHGIERPRGVNAFKFIKLHIITL